MRVEQLNEDIYTVVGIETGCYVSWELKSDLIVIDGAFKADELRRILDWVDKSRAQPAGSSPPAQHVDQAATG